MNVTTIIGSPKTQGHGATLAKELLELLGPAAQGAKTYELAYLAYTGCIACMKCKTDFERCVLPDGMSLVLRDVAQSDLVVLSAPVYMGEVNGQAKLALDRFYSFLKPDFRTNPKASRLAPGKQLVFILTQGSPDASAFAGALKRQAGMFDRYGFSRVHVIHACGAGRGDEINISPAAHTAVAEAAKAILSAGK